MQYPEATVQSQYAASPTIRRLVDGFNAEVDPRNDIKLFYDKIFNPATAQGIGLDYWARIVGVERNIFVDDLSENFGFFVSGTPSAASYEIPSAVQDLPGYGCSAGDVYNYVDFDAKKYIQRVGSVDMGDLDWFKTAISGTSSYRFTAVLSDMKAVAQNVVANILCPKYTTTTAYAYSTIDKSIACAGATAAIGVHDTDYDSVTRAEFRTAMSGVMLYYELATPIETDISEYITSTPKLPVAPDTAITFANSNGSGYQIPVPSEISYTVGGEVVTDDTEAYQKTVGNTQGDVTVNMVGGKTIIDNGVLVSAGVTNIAYSKKVTQEWQPWDQGVFFEPDTVKRGSYRIDDNAFRKFIFWKALANISTSDCYTLNRLLSKLFDSPVIVTETGVMQIRMTATRALEDWQKAVLMQYGLFGKPCGVGYEFWTIETPVLGLVPDGENYRPLGQAPIYSGVMQKEIGG